MARGRGRGKRRGGSITGRLSRPKKPRVSKDVVLPPRIPSPPPVPVDTSEEDFERVRNLLDTASPTFDTKTALDAFTSLCEKHGSERTLLACRNVPRVILQALADNRRYDLLDSISKALVTIACTSGDGEASLRARKWGSRLIVNEVRGKKGSVFEHGAAPPHVAGVAPRDILDEAAARVLSGRIVSALESPASYLDTAKLNQTSKGLLPLLNIPTALPAISALLSACIRVSTPLEGYDSASPLAPEFVDALLASEATKNLDDAALGALIVVDERSRSLILGQSIDEIERRLFATLETEERLCHPLGIAASHDLHFHWALLDSAAGCSCTGQSHPFGRRAWAGRRSRRAVLSAAWRACEQAEDITDFSASISLGPAPPATSYRLPRRSRALIQSISAYARGATVTSQAGMSGVKQLSFILNSGIDETRTLLACEHGLEILVVAAAANEMPEEALGGARYGLGAALKAGRVAGGRKISRELLRKEAKDGFASSELVRALAVAALYTSWADKANLRETALVLLDECTNVHRRDKHMLGDIEENMQWWERIGKTR